MRLQTPLSLSLLLFAFINGILPEGVLAQALTTAGEGPPQPGFAEILSKMAPMFILVFFIFYFLVVRPQNAKSQQQQTLLSGLKKGDAVITSSGIFGKIASIEAEAITLDVASNVRMKFEKSAIARKEQPSSGSVSKS